MRIISLILFVGICTVSLITCDKETPIFSQFAAHRFLQVGETIELGEMGEILEVIQLSSDGVLEYNETFRTIRCLKGGTGCVRAKYRDDSSQNEVQTQCFICISETASCEEQTQASLNLENFLEGDVPGDANYLAQGDQFFYGVCQVDGKYHLQQSTQELPTLMLRMVDALGDGPYSLGDDEIEPQRNSDLTTYSGQTLFPPWLVVGGGEISIFSINTDGTVVINDPDCKTWVDCSSDPDLLQEGDIFSISHGFPSDEMIQAIMADTVKLDAFVTAHNIPSWQSSAELFDAGARQFLVQRLIALEIMRKLITFYDNLYSLRTKKIKIAYWSYPHVRHTLNDSCLPSEREDCENLELEVATEETRVISQWINEGYDLWTMNSLAYQRDGTYNLLSEEPPHFSNFNGLVLNINPTGLDSGIDLKLTLTQAIEEVSKEIGALPIIISPWARPMTFYLEEWLCEEAICQSDFSNYYEVNEAIFIAALNNFPLSQIISFVLPSFDGAHFDIRFPQETRNGQGLNRAGETGYNNPLLNIYLSR